MASLCKQAHFIVSLNGSDRDPVRRGLFRTDGAGVVVSGATLGPRRTMTRAAIG
jgi:hypothetical protein